MTQDSSEKQQTIQITDANLKDPAHQHAVLQLVDAYSMDEMGDGKPLSEEARGRLLQGLREHPTTHISIAWDGGRPVGVAVCFRGFSTFAARPLLNIHDIAVLPGYRGKGVGRKLLESVEQKARQMGCCKLTLEVVEKNQRARTVYESFGFAHAVSGEGAGHCFFMSKKLM